MTDFNAAEPSREPDPATERPVEESAWRIVRRLLGYTKRYWRLFAVAVVAMAVDAICTAGFTALLQPLLDEGFLAEYRTSVALLPLWVILLVSGRGVASLAADYTMAAAGRSVVLDLRQALFDQYLGLPSSYFDRRSQGQLVSKLTYNVEQIAEASTTAISVFFRDSFYVLGFLGVMLYYSVGLTLVVLLIGPFLALLIRVVTRRFRTLSRRIQETMGDVTHRATEVIVGQQLVKLLGAQEQERQRFGSINRDNRRQHLKMVLTRSGSAAAVNIVAGIGLAGTIYLATSGSAVEAMSPGAFIAFMTAMLGILPSLKRLTNILATIQKGVAAADSVFATLDQVGEVDEGDKAVQLTRGEVRYEGVSFGYLETQSDAVSDIDLIAKPGTVTAIVGRSGSGKTTLVNLLPRFYNPSVGHIFVDGYDIAQLRLAELRAHIALVSQHIVLFDGTIAANIAYGRLRNAERSAIEAAARESCVMEFAEALPDGLDTLLGEGGIQLSGGQRQRIAIARAILQDAPILILDEATSALDSHSEKLIQTALAKFQHQRTTLVIAHRLSTVENADQVIAMEAGKIVEHGTHAELLQRNGVYAGLYRMQFND